MTPRLKPFFLYFGAKWRGAPHYPVPDHDTIVEPFAGAAGYATRFPDRQVILVDRFPAIVKTWEYMIQTPESEILALPDVVAGTTVDDYDLPEGARCLIGWWLNHGSSSPRKSMSSWGRQCPDSFWGQMIRERIARQLHAIRHWKVIQGDYSDAPDVNATWCIDPPYQDAGRNYKFGSSTLDYQELGEWCRTRRGQVIVCENEGAHWLPFSPLFLAKSASGKHRPRSHRMEVIWTSPEQKA